MLGSVALTLLFGVFLPATNDLTERSHAAAQLPVKAGNGITPTTAPAVAAAAGGPQASAR